MAYRYTGGMTLDDLLNIDPEQLINMPKPALREVVSRMSQAANKRIRRASKHEYASPAVQAAQRGGEFGTWGKDITQLRNEYARARGFLGNKLSTVSGYRELQKDTRQGLKELGYNVKLKDMPKLLNAYQQLTQEDGSVLTRGERYKYLREMGQAANITEKAEAEKTGEALLNALADSLGDIGEEGDSFEADDSGIAGFFRELE